MLRKRTDQFSSLANERLDAVAICCHLLGAGLWFEKWAAKALQPTAKSSCDCLSSCSHTSRPRVWAEMQGQEAIQDVPRHCLPLVSYHPVLFDADSRGWNFGSQGNSQVHFQKTHNWKKKFGPKTQGLPVMLPSGNQTWLENPPDTPIFSSRISQPCSGSSSEYRSRKVLKPWGSDGKKEGFHQQQCHHLLLRIYPRFFFPDGFIHIIYGSIRLENSIEVAPAPHDGWEYVFRATPGFRRLLQWCAPHAPELFLGLLDVRKKTDWWL